MNLLDIIWNDKTESRFFLTLCRTTSWLTSCAANCPQTRPSTASRAWPPTRALTVSPEPWTTCPSPRLYTGRATSEHWRRASWPGTILSPLRSPPRAPTRLHSPVQLCWYFVLFSFLYVSGLIFLSVSSVTSQLSSFVTAPSSPPSLRLCCVCFSSQSSDSPGLQRGRDKMWVFLSLIFFRKMNKVNIILLYWTKKRYFSSPG